MQLDTAIEQRKREINNISNDINGEKDQTEAFGQNLRQKQLDLLNAQLDRSKMLYKNQKFATMGTRYNEISTSKLPFYPFANISAYFRPIPSPDARQPGWCHSRARAPEKLGDRGRPE